MGLISNLISRVRASYSMEDFDREVRTRMYGINHAGVTVNESTAMRQATVASCIRVLSEAMISLPLAVYREQEGKREKATDHPLYYLLHDAPNDEMTSCDWMESKMQSLVPSGNCYSVITRNRRGEIMDIYPVPWHQAQPYRDPKTKKIWYRITDDDGHQEEFSADRVLHVRLFSGNGLIGKSLIQMASEYIGIGMAATEFLARFYGQGMNIGGVLEHPETLSEQAIQHLREDLEQRGAGLANSWRPLILEEGMKYTRIAMPFKDAQLVEMLKLGRDEICGLFRVPPHMIANLERATFSNIEHLSLEFVIYTLLPYVRRFEMAMNQKLFTRQERQAGYYVKFNLEGLLRGDYKSRQEGLAIQRQNGIINADEWREMEEMNPIDGPAGEAYLVNGNMISTETAAKQLPRQTKGGGTTEEQTEE